MAKWRDASEKDYTLPSLDEELKVIKEDRNYLIKFDKFKVILINVAIGVFILENIYLFFTRYEQNQVLYHLVQKIATSILNFF